ncbi:MAG: general secretion pathway protein K [Halioglobus sp.]
MKSVDCMNYPRISRRGERGAALVVALLVFALCTALIVAMKSEFMLYYQRGANVFISEQVYAYLRGAEELAKLALLQDYDADQLREQPRDELTEDWALDPDRAVPYDLDEGGWLRGGLEDLQGRFNLNALVDTATSAEGETKIRYTSAQKQFIRLLQALEGLELGEQEAIAVTESIGDWLDADSRPRPNGAEDSYYVGLTPAYRAANQLITSVSELRAIAGVTPQLYDALRPWVAALPEQASVLNILTAPPMLLRTINDDASLQPLSEADGLLLEEVRADESFADVKGFLDNPVFEGKDQREIQSRLGVSSSYFLLSSEAKVAERKLRLYSVLERKGRTIIAITRTNEGLCPSEKKEGKFCKTAP